MPKPYEAMKTIRVAVFALRGMLHGDEEINIYMHPDTKRELNAYSYNKIVIDPSGETLFGCPIIEDETIPVLKIFVGQRVEVKRSGRI